MVLRAAVVLCRSKLCSLALRFYSTDIVGANPILVRNFIHSALYHPEHGYFSKRSGPVGVLQSSIRFNQLQGRSAYMKYLDKLYKMHDISWFTPVELFKPWYAYAIAEAIMRTANLSVPLKIYEIGGGSGTCAKGILDYVMLNAPPKVYSSMKYTCVEISPSLAQKQRETIGEVRSHLSKFNVECRDATDRNGWGKKETQPCWVIMLEVLDNLPHDLVYSSNQASPWMEVWLQKVNDSQVSEVHKPIQDPLISRCMGIIGTDIDNQARGRIISKIVSRIFPKPRQAWLPTGCLHPHVPPNLAYICEEHPNSFGYLELLPDQNQGWASRQRLLETLHSALPNMSLIASDFSYLPDVTIAGDRAPLVSSKKDGKTVDHHSYLDAKGDADIFFPTDFWLLERIDHACSGFSNHITKPGAFKPLKKRRTITLESAAFMEEFGLPLKTRTKDGYNPLLDDFRNTKFYLSVPTHNIK